MTNDQLIAKFNPANAANLTPEDLELLRGLTDDQINALAEAYPNQPQRRSYLRLYNTSLPANKQLYPLSTWQNLRNARKFSGLKTLIPYDFIATAAQMTKQMRPVANQLKAGVGGSPKKVTVDLSAQEAAAELKANVEKKPAMETKSLTAKPPKTTASPKSKTPKAPKKVDAPGVDKGTQPADQQFTDGA